jgi:hypothetical protein
LADGPEEDWHLLNACAMAEPLATVGWFGEGPLLDLNLQNRGVGVDMNVVTDYCDLFRAIASQRDASRPSLWICKDLVLPMHLDLWLKTFDVLGDGDKK